ncbi:sphingosine kinase 2 isoform X2 [Lepisosteus oculatus]|uniref:sphingosine kinase 2 isoform X2 n=1 Tax=Lepisosteus oculatus TaxID=7918 RepID=UPI0035F50896
MRCPDPPCEALLHGQFQGSAGSSGSAAAGYALTLTPTQLHMQRLRPRPGRDARTLLPLAELLGCQCPRAPAPPLLLLYWYPPPRRRRGGGAGRRRQVRAFLAESRAEAERWAAAVECLLRGVPVSASTEFSRSLLPRPRRLLLLVNPFSGRGQAMELCQTHILPMIRESGISYNLIQTERQNHARELVRQISLFEWDGIVIVSGDGLLHEVINGLMERPDWEQAIKTPLGILPCGSGNALAGAINHHAGYEMCLREALLMNCCFLLCKGGVRPMDLVSVTTTPGAPKAGSRPGGRLFSFLSVAWGFVSDVDIESERYRGLGSARFTLGTLVRLASLRSYRGRLSYLPPAASPAGTPPPHRRPLSRSITEGLGGLAHAPLLRTVSDLGLSEQRSLRRAREAERPRPRPAQGGVARASSLAEDREAEARSSSGSEGGGGSGVEEQQAGEGGRRGSESGQRGSESDRRGSESGQRGSESDRRGSESDRRGSESGQTDSASCPRSPSLCRCRHRRGDQEHPESAAASSPTPLEPLSVRPSPLPRSQNGTAVKPSPPPPLALPPPPDSPASPSPSPSLRSPPSSFTFELAEPAGAPRHAAPAPPPGPAAPLDGLLPPLDQPLPARDWVTVEGDFVLVLALYQTHLGADLLAAPQARFDDGLIHLTFVRAGVSRATLLRLFLAMERGAHLGIASPYVCHTPARAFRLLPLSPRGTLTVDGELVPYGPLQAQIHPSMARLIVGDTGVRITRL